MKSTHALLASFLAAATLANAQPAPDGQSEIGVQQAVQTDDSTYAGAAGYEFQYIGRSNPFYVDNPVGDAAKSRVMVNTFFGTVSLPEVANAGPLQNSSVGVVHQTFRYQEDLLTVFDYDVTSAYYKTDIDATLRGWKPSFTLAYSRIEIAEENLEAFDGFVPSFSLAKKIGGYLATIKTAYGITDIKGGAAEDADRLNAWNTGLTLHHHHAFGDRIGLASKANLTYSYYTEGTNDGRDDFLTSAGTSLYYALNKYVRADLFADYSRRTSSNDLYKFNNWDGGLRVRTMLQF